MMKRTQLVANRLREVILDGRWIANTNFKDQLNNVTFKKAIAKQGELNTITELTFHISYYISGILNVFENGELNIRDKYSFDCPKLNSKSEWNDLINSFYSNTEKLISFIENMPDEMLDEVFVDAKYGSYQRNIEAMIEHSYYHLGQLVLMAKILQN